MATKAPSAAAGPAKLVDRCAVNSVRVERVEVGRAESAHGHQQQVHRAELRGGPLGEGVETLCFGDVERPREHAPHTAGAKLGGGRLKTCLVPAGEHNG